jgi:hypothetical protein
MIRINSIETRIGGDDEGITVVWEREAVDWKGGLFIERVHEDFSIWWPKYILIKYLKLSDIFRKRKKHEK